MQTVVNSAVSDAYFDPGELKLVTKEAAKGANPFAPSEGGELLIQSSSVKRIITKIQRRK